MDYDYSSGCVSYIYFFFNLASIAILRAAKIIINNKYN